MSSMSSSLLKERELFNKRQAEASTFLVNNEKRQKNEFPTTNNAQKTARSNAINARSKTNSDLNGEQRQMAQSGPKFRHLQSIVDKLKERFQSEENEPLSLDEIIREFDLKIEQPDRHWLASQALLDNPKIEVIEVENVNKFLYKPPLDLKGTKKQTALLNLLKSRHEQCEGALTFEDVRDSIPKGRAGVIVQKLIESGEIVKKTVNRKDILYYADREHDLRVNSGFKDLWGKISVDSQDYQKVLDVLKNHGVDFIHENTPRFTKPTTKPTKRSNRKTDLVKHNQHVKDQLQDFSEGFGGK